ncbi:MAG: RDD family protein, partial [Gemmatimonadota bacterium]
LLELMRPAGVGDLLLNLGLPAVGVIAFWVYRSATPGKMATRTRLVDATTGGTPSTKQCVVRYLGYFVSIAGFFAGFLWIAFDRRKQGWHDKLAGTVVVRLAPGS